MRVEPITKAELQHWLERRLGVEKGAFDEKPLGKLPDHPLFKLLGNQRSGIEWKP